VALTVVIFLIIFWRVPFGRPFWQALSRGALACLFLGAHGVVFLCVFFLLDNLRAEQADPLVPRGRCPTEISLPVTGGGPTWSPLSTRNLPRVR